MKHRREWQWKVSRFEEVSDPQEPRRHCFVLLLITKPDCSNEHQVKCIIREGCTHTHTLTHSVTQIIAHSLHQSFTHIFLLKKKNQSGAFRSVCVCVFVFFSVYLPYLTPSVCQEQLADFAQSASSSDSCHSSGRPLSKQRWTWSMPSNSSTGCTVPPSLRARSHTHTLSHRCPR